MIREVYTNPFFAYFSKTFIDIEKEENIAFFISAFTTYVCAQFQLLMYNIQFKLSMIFTLAVVACRLEGRRTSNSAVLAKLTKVLEPSVRKNTHSPPIGIDGT